MASAEERDRRAGLRPAVALRFPTPVDTLFLFLSLSPKGHKFPCWYPLQPQHDEFAFEVVRLVLLFAERDAAWRESLR